MTGQYGGAPSAPWIAPWIDHSLAKVSPIQERGDEALNRYALLFTQYESV